MLDAVLSFLSLVQHDNLPFTLYGLGWDSVLSLRPYENRLKVIGLSILEKRRKLLSVTFLFKLIEGDIHSPTSLEYISISIRSIVSRYFVLLKLPLMPTLL